MSESYVERAELLADLGRYDEAAAELEQAVVSHPGDVPALTLLARVKLAAGAPKEALGAADAAVAAGPADLPALIARGMALADLGQVDEAAAQAEQILRRGKGNGYACTSAAAILAEVRGGQVALDAAWEGVRLAPDQPRAHLVLGVVATRLGLDEIAERAYREALALDPQLSVAQAALGAARAEQHRYAQALSHLAKADDQPGSARDGGGPLTDRLHRMLQYGAGFTTLAPLLVAWAYAAGAGAVGLSVLLAVLGLAGLWLARSRLPHAARSELVGLVRADPRLAVTTWAIVVAPVLLLLFAVIRSPWPLVAAIGAGAVALVANRPRS